MIVGMLQRLVWRWVGAHLPTQADFDALEAAIREQGERMGLNVDGR